MSAFEAVSVICVETGKIYGSISDLSKELGDIGPNVRQRINRFTTGVYGNHYIRMSDFASELAKNPRLTLEDVYIKLRNERRKTDIEMEDYFKPDVTYRLEQKLIGQEYGKVYLCPQCHKDVALGQMRCACGLPLIWEGINEYDTMMKRRKKWKK